MIADPHLIQGGFTYVFCSENGKHVNQTLNPMGRQIGNTIFTGRSDPAAAVRTAHPRGTSAGIREPDRHRVRHSPAATASCIIPEFAHSRIL